MLRVSVWLAAAVIGVPSVATAQAKPQLQATDFVVAGVPADVDTSAVRHILGAPDSVTTTADDPSQASGSLLAWWYSDLEFVIVGAGTVHGAWLRGPSRATARGLRVGAPRAAVERLYGFPSAPSDSLVDYSEHKRNGRSIFVYLTRNRVAAIYVGHLLD